MEERTGRKMRVYSFEHLMGKEAAVCASFDTYNATNPMMDGALRNSELN
jgi:hypothetical protein